MPLPVSGTGVPKSIVFVESAVHPEPMIWTAKDSRVTALFKITNERSLPCPVVPTQVPSKVGGPVTVTIVGLAGELQPAADAVTVADPDAAPVTCGWVTGTVAPFRITTVAGTDTLLVSLLISATVRFAGA